MEVSSLNNMWNGSCQMQMNFKGFLTKRNVLFEHKERVLNGERTTYVLD